MLICPLATSGPPATHASHTRSAAPARVVIIGDSLSTGYGTAREEAWPNLIMMDFQSGDHPLDIVNAAKNGSGYVRAGEDAETFGSQVAAAVTAGTQVVMFFGSENDMGSDKAQLKRAAADAYAAAKVAAPGAVIIVVGPPCYTDAPEPERLQVRDQDKAAALEAGATFVDPIEGRWIVGRADELIGPDGDHPSGPGQRYLKAMMGGLLATLTPQDKVQHTS
ncbi:SGNH/GDSL hydrolase family protein [Pseudarthrobacter sp. N5]|uniref:SGNH/GDSL hydrolase family protein n=1 Tax=Pseudarthrobacter sp. N5 TaxID=3418416 RepID=UPI003CF18BC3